MNEKAVPESPTTARVKVNSILKNRSRYTGRDYEKRNLTRSFDDTQTSFDSTLDRYHLKDTLPEKEGETTLLSMMCVGIVNTLGCGGKYLFRNSTSTKKIGVKMDAKTIQSSMERNIHPGINSDFAIASTNMPACRQYRQQQHALAFGQNSRYQEKSHEVQCNKTADWAPKEQRNDEGPSQLTRRRTDLLLDELRQSPV